MFDLWAERWRHREAVGNVIIVRYADDLIIGFELDKDARRFQEAMFDRLREFSLSLHPEKTRLIEFGRFAVERRTHRFAVKHPRWEPSARMGPARFCAGGAQ